MSSTQGASQRSTSSLPTIDERIESESDSESCAELEEVLASLRIAGTRPMPVTSPMCSIVVAVWRMRPGPLTFPATPPSRPSPAPKEPLREVRQKQRNTKKAKTGVMACTKALDFSTKPMQQEVGCAAFIGMLSWIFGPAESQEE